MANASTIHACALLLGSKGVLIRGASGSGKSSLARLLIEEYRRESKFSRWVADDQVKLVFHPLSTIAEVPETIAGLAERRYCGIDTLEYEKAARIDLVVELIPLDQLERLPERKTIALNEHASPLPIVNAPANNVQHALEIVFGHLN